MKRVKAKINKTEVQQIIASKNEQIEFASSIMALSLLQETHLQIPDKMLNESFESRREIMGGKIKITIAIMAIIPQAFLIKPMLDITVRSASFIEVPTIGIKLLIANLAVLIDTESVL